MSINNYPFDVAFVRGVTELTGEQVSALEAIGLDYDEYKRHDAKHLQVWCGGLKDFAIVSDQCVHNALSYENSAKHSEMFFDTVEDLVVALS